LVSVFAAAQVLESAPVGESDEVEEEGDGKDERFDSIPAE